MFHAHGTFSISLSSHVYFRQDEELIDIFKNNPRLDINRHDIPGMNGVSCFEFALFIGNYGLAKKLVQEGFYVKESLVGSMKSFLDYFCDRLEVVQELIEILELIKKNASEGHANDNVDLHSVAEKNINATLQVNVKDDVDVIGVLIRSLMDGDRMDAEFIADFVGIITAGHYSGEVIELVQPMTDYFERVIHKEFLQYQYNHDVSDVCLALPEHGLMFANTYY